MANDQVGSLEWQDVAPGEELTAKPGAEKLTSRVDSVWLASPDDDVVLVVAGGGVEGAAAGNQRQLRCAGRHPQRGGKGRFEVYLWWGVNGPGVEGTGGVRDFDGIAHLQVGEVV